MGESSAVEWFAQASPYQAYPPVSVAQAFGNQLKFFPGRPHSEAFSKLLENATSREGDPEDPVGQFLRSYEPIFREFESMFSRDREATEARAVFNQQLAQGLYIAHERYDIQEPAIRFVQTIRAMNDAKIPLGVACNLIVSGARAHAGLMEVFQRNGYSIAMPDSDNLNEVSLWDNQAGTDFVAHKVGETAEALLLIDAKSDSSWTPGNFYRGYNYVVASGNNRNKRVWNTVATSALHHLGGRGSERTGVEHVVISLQNPEMDDLGSISQDLGRQLIHSLEKKLGI